MKLFIILFFFAATGCRNYFIPSGSMEPTIKIGDHIFVSLINVHPVKRNDIVIFHPPVGSEKNKEYHKRCIAIEGDNFVIKNNTVFINGKKIDEPFTVGSTQPGPSPISGVVPKGMTVVLGDNREHSYDSRHFGYVPESDVHGKAFYVYWNSNDFSRRGKIK